MLSLTLVIISAHRLWAEACSSSVHQFQSILTTAPIVTEGEMTPDLWQELGACPDVLLVSLDLPNGTLPLLRTLRAIGYQKPIIVVCSQYTPPALEVLEELAIAAVIFSNASLAELESALDAVIAGQPQFLTQSYLNVARTLVYPLPHDSVSSRDQELLQLLAEELTDKEIADALHLSPPTVSTYLRDLYSKLRVKGRVGAVRWGIRMGLIPV